MARPHSALRAISLSGILADDSAQVANLLEACSTDGCFYLIVQESENDNPSCSTLRMADEVFKLAEELFELPLQEKLRWEMDKWGDLQIGG